MTNKICKIGLFAAIPAFLAGAVFAFSNRNEVKIAYAWSGEQTPSVAYSYYSSCEGLDGEALKTALKSFNNPTGLSESDYDNNRFKDADKAENANNYILSLYTRHTILANRSGASDGHYSWDRWNREHIYTQTAFPASKYDNHNIFACEGYTNSRRSNFKYANARQLFYDVTEIITEDNHHTGCYITPEGQTGFFEPSDASKGEVARAVLYCALYYDYSITSIAYNVDTILSWHNSHPVSNREIYRNNRVYYNQGNRNPFVDHPSYVSKIFGGTAYPEVDPLSNVIHPTSVTLNRSSATLAIGETVQLTATVNPDNAENKQVKWTSSNPSVANINPSTGVVTAYSVGESTITVTTLDGNKTAKCKITVTGGSSSTGGCGGNIVTTSITLSTLSIVGLGLLLITRKVSRKKGEK